MLNAWPPPGSRYRRGLTLCALALVTLLLSPAAWTEEKVGLVLSGGGARGLAHIGVIKALEELGITIHAVAGTSMGGIVGALYASGKTTDEIEHVARNLDWAEAFSDQPERGKLSFRRKQDSREYLVKAHATFDGGVLSLPKGIVQGQNLQLLLQRQFVHVSHITDFDKLPIPFRVVAADIVTGDAVVLGSGSLPSSVRASMSVPGIFAPVEIDDRILVDGGIANNLPVDVAKEMGVDRVIAIDITSPLLNAEQLDSVIPIIEQLTTLLTYNQMKARFDLLDESDVLITPDLTGLPASAFDRPDDLIERGYQAAMAMRDQLTHVAALAATREITRTAASQPPVVADITVANDSSISDKLILAQIRQPTGAPLDRDALEEDLASVYGYDYFESVNYRLQPGEGETTLAIDVREKSWGRDLLGVSFEIFSDSNGDASYNIAANYRKARLTRRGGEWFSVAQIGQNTSLRSEFYLPIDYKQRFFLRPYASYRERLFDAAISNHVESRANISTWTSGLFAGTEISNKAILGVGIESDVGKGERLVGPNAVDVSHRDQVTYLLVEADSLNNLYFPNEGIFTTVRYDRVRPTGGRQRFDRLTAELTAAVAMGPHSLVLGTRYVGTDSKAAGIHQMTNLGGFLNLSGIRSESLNDMSQLFARLTYLHRLDQQSILPVDLPVYVGVSLEAGNVFPDRHAITSTDLIGSASLMVALDSPLGPLYFGYGRADGGDSAFYLKLGRLF